MELRHLRYFTEAAEAGHFGKAAKRMNVVQSTLSMQIRDLEDEIGTPLFARAGKGVSLTNAGLKLYPEARRILAHADQLKLQAQRAARGETGRLRIGYTSFAIATSRLTSDLRRFHELCPDVSIQLHELTPEQQLKKLQQGSLDVGYAPDFGLERDKGSDINVLMECAWFVALPDGHRLTKGAAVDAADLRTESFIICGSATTSSDTAHSAVIENLLGFHPASVQVIDQSLTGLAMVAAGLGVSIVPEPLSRIAIPYLVFRRLDAAGASLSLALLTRQQESLGPVLTYRDLSLSRRLANV